MNLLRRLGSLRLALAGMAALLVAVLAGYLADQPLGNWMAVPLALLCVNLVCALLSNPRFRVQHGLLVFHLGLLAVLGLALAGLLTRYEARLRVAEGQRLADAPVEVLEAGPWYRDRLAALDLVQGPVTVAYSPGLRMGRLDSRLVLAQGAAPRELTVSRNKSLLLEGYRFNATSNKGMAALLEWRDADAGVQVGAVNFPSYPLLAWRQEMAWRTPAGQDLELALELPPVPDQADWVLSARTVQGALLVRAEGQEHRLAPGESVALQGGTLAFAELRMWMGYRVEYAPLVPWVIAAGLVAILGIALHFYASLFRRPGPAGAVALRQARAAT